MTMNKPANILETIVAQKRVEIASLPPGSGSAKALREAVGECGPRRDFVAALKSPARGDVGLIAEVKRLRAEGFAANPSAAGAIGYRETLAMLDGQIAESELLSAIVANTRALVKKQIGRAHV